MREMDPRLSVCRGCPSGWGCTSPWGRAEGAVRPLPSLRGGDSLPASHPGLVLGMRQKRGGGRYPPHCLAPHPGV